MNQNNPQKYTRPVICRNNNDNEDIYKVVSRLVTLRSDSDYHGDLLAMLCLPYNREAMRKGEFGDLFEMIDTYAAGHRERMASIDVQSGACE